MNGKELIDYLVVTNQLQVKENYNINLYSNRITKRCVETLSKYDEDISKQYKLLYGYLKDTYEIYEILDRLAILVVNNKISLKGLRKLIKNIEMILKLDDNSKKNIFESFVININNLEKGKELEINKYKIPIGNMTYTIVINNNMKCDVWIDKNSGKIQARLMRQLNNKILKTDFSDIKYIIWDNKGSCIRENYDYNKDKSYYYRNDRDRLKLYFVKHI